MFRIVILTAKLAGCCSVRSMELTCSLSRQLFLRHGTNGFATCSRECHSATKPLHWLNGRRATEPSDIWANGTPIRKTAPTRLASIDRNGTVCRPSVGISDQRSLSLLADMPCILSWCQAQAKDQYSPLWNSGTQTNVVAACRLRRAGGRPGAPGHPTLRRGTRVGVHLSPRQGQLDPAGRAAVGDLPGTAGQREPAADPAAQRRIARRGGVHCGGDVQEVSLTDHWPGATHYELHRPPGHGDVEVLRTHALDI